MWQTIKRWFRRGPAEDESSMKATAIDTTGEYFTVLPDSGYYIEYGDNQRLYLQPGRYTARYVFGRDGGTSVRLTRTPLTEE